MHCQCLASTGMSSASMAFMCSTFSFTTAFRITIELFVECPTAFRITTELLEVSSCWLSSEPSLCLALPFLLRVLPCTLNSSELLPELLRARSAAALRNSSVLLFSLFIDSSALNRSSAVNRSLISKCLACMAACVIELDGKLPGAEPKYGDGVVHRGPHVYICAFPHTCRRTTARESCAAPKNRCIINLAREAH